MSKIAFSINDVRQMWTDGRLRRRLTRACIEPGGFLQWDELDTPTAHVTVAAPDLDTEALEQLRELVTLPRKGRNGEYGPLNDKFLRLMRASIDHWFACRTLLGPRDWIEALPENLERNGFCDVQKDSYCEAPYMSLFWVDV